MTKFEEVPVATVEMIPTFDGNEIKFKPSSKLGSYLIAEGEVELYLKPQYQPLPVVSKDVAEWIEILKTKGLKPLKNPETYGETGFTEEKLQNIVFWISENQEDYMRAWLDGYTVEKPQQKSTAWKPGAMSLFLWRTENEKIFQEKAWKRSIEKKLEDIKNR